jgi:DDE family transposase/transposase IS4-like protein
VARSSGKYPRVDDALSVGALTSVVTRQVVLDSLADAPRSGARSRKLPDVVVVYFVIAMALFSADGYQEVVRKMVESFRLARWWNGIWSVPTASALCQARSRVPASLMGQVFRRTATVLGAARTPGCWLGQRRLMAIDGTSFDLPDSAVNEEEFGRRRGVKVGSFPQAQVVGLMEVGTHAVIAAEIGGAVQNERTLALRLLDSFTPEMLVLADRGFYSFDFFRDLRETGADLLFRVQSGMRLVPRKFFSDGSYLSEVSTDRHRRKKLRYPSDVADVRDATAIPVRVIEYMVTDRGKPGERETICLVTTILDPDDASAEELARAYAQRWEIELAFDEIKNHMLVSRKTLRSRSPEFVRQEIWGILLAHYATRSLMIEGARQQKQDPDRMSFTHAASVVRRTMISQAVFPPAEAKGYS